MEEQLARGPMDLPFLMLVVLLTGIGVIMVFSASYATAYIQEGRSPTFYFFRQGMFAVAGLAIMYVVSKINYQTFRWLSVFALIVAILLLIAVLIPGIHTDRSDNVKRWIAVPGTRRSLSACPPAAPSAGWWASWIASAFWSWCPTP